ncbi:sigma-70 family RNA polymerase sigma factor [Paenibacillus sp. KQZ6P-2]|uniref:Sigma-70 family RNA polymerase sigma factor n=1 Tax=Paenibacillus mangrovi TaxID=2931978 RepID=A0A9X2B6B5_9BACL|nr:sigma-70 family RNA polymerase sigma factor [Paenibacillus mangrovi]
MNEELYQIIHRAKHGDREAFADLVRRYKGLVFRYAMGMLNDRMDAEDASQEAFVKAFFSLSNLDNEYAFSSWLFRIVSNLCKDRLKKITKERMLVREVNETIVDTNFSDPLERLSIEEGISRLSVEHREVILLHDIEGFRYEEIADMIEVPLGTIKSRLFAARMALRKQLRGEDK